MTSGSPPLTHREAGCADCTDGLGPPVAVTKGSFRDRGLAAAAVAFWAVGHFQLVERGKDALGL